MKNLRPALECGDMIAAKSGLLSPEEMFQDAGDELPPTDLIADVTEKLGEDDTPSKISMESFVRPSQPRFIVLRKEYQTPAMEGLSEGMIYLIGAVILAITSLILRFTSRGSKGSSGGGGGGGGYKTIEFRFERTQTFNKKVDQFDEDLKRFQEELKRTKPHMRKPNPSAAQKAQTVDLNERPSAQPPTQVHDMDEVIDVVYKDVDSSAKERFMDVGDPILTDFIEKGLHFQAVSEFSYALSKTVDVMQNALKIIEGAASHDLVADLSAGHLREVYTWKISEKKLADLVSSEGMNAATIKDAARIFGQTLRDQAGNTQVKHRSYTEMINLIRPRAHDLNLEGYYSAFEKADELIKRIGSEIERLGEKVKEVQVDENSTQATKDAVQGFTDWLKSVGEYLASFMTIQHHIETYDDRLRAAVLAFVNMGQHAFDVMMKNIEPHEKSELQDVYREVQKSNKEIRQIGHSK